jgi:hypothetical protein
MIFRTIRNIGSVTSVLLVSLTLTNRAKCQRPPAVPPQPIKLVEPHCAVEKSCHGIHGIVVITVNVLTDGTVGDADVKSGDPR